MNQVDRYTPDNNPIQQHTGVFSSLPNAPLCTDCDFLRYGFWTSEVQYGPHTDKMGGWWVGTNEAPISSSVMPTRGTAYYSGLAVGTLAERQPNSSMWNQTTGVTGNMTMDWDFAKRHGDLAITNFGDKNFGGKMFAPGRVDFSGIIAGSGGIGAARGSFVGANPGGAPKGVMGDFGIAGNHWKANGIYGGGLKSFTPGQ